MRTAISSDIRGSHRRQLPLALVALSCTVVVAACGSSGKSSSGGSNAKFAAGVRFADCMRSHGVSNFPDPSAGGGISITPGSGIDPRSPAFQSAQSACFKMLPGGGPSHGKPTESAKLAMLKTARCMRAHGLTNFPDPTTSPPGLGSGSGLVLGRGGVFLSLPPGVSPQSPAFRQAAGACNFPVPGAGPGGAKVAPTG